MRMMKKLVCLMLAVLMVAGCFAGCGGSKDVTATTTTETAAADTSAAAETAATEETTEVGAGLEEVVIDQVDVDLDNMTYSEAPVLAEKVAAGELPPVEERIPDKDNVYVETTMRDGTALEIGTYGGVLRQAKTKFGDWDCCRFTSLERPVDFYKDGTSYLNVLKDLQHNEDYTVWTMYLREGMRWSDGELFTADDITFWYYMLHKNDYDGIAYWAALFQYDDDGNQVWADLEKVDDYTVTWTFIKPQYSANFCETGDFKWCWAPQHFYADKVPSSYYIDNPYWEDTGLTEEECLANYLACGMEFATIGKAKNCAYKPWKYYQIPTLSAWMITSEEGFNTVDGEIAKFVRNPYYWKVDAEGQQLPYLDEIWYVHVNDADQAILKLESGEVDFTNVDITDVAAVNEAMGDGVETKVLKSTCWGHDTLCFNLTHKDPAMNAILNNISFRKAMSISVDRNEVVNLWYDGLTVAQNSAPQYPNFGYNEEWAQYNCEYDPEEAIRLLTEDVGLVMGDDGYFNYPDGSDLEFTAVTKLTDAVYAEQFAVLKKYWDAVGLKVNLVQTTDAETIFDSNEGWDLAFDDTSIQGYKIESRPKQFIPLNLAATWYSFYDYRGSAYNPEFHDLSENPELEKLYNTYLEWLAIPELADRDEKELEMMEILITNQWFLAFSSEPDQYYMTRTGYGNWANEMLNEDKFNFFMMFNWWTVYDTSASAQ